MICGHCTSALSPRQHQDIANVGTGLFAAYFSASVKSELCFSADKFCDKSWLSWVWEVLWPVVDYRTSVLET